MNLWSNTRILGMFFFHTFVDYILVHVWIASFNGLWDSCATFGPSPPPFNRFVKVRIVGGVTNLKMSKSYFFSFRLNDLYRECLYYNHLSGDWARKTLENELFFLKVDWFLNNAIFWDFILKLAFFVIGDFLSQLASSFIVQLLVVFIEILFWADTLQFGCLTG